VSFVCAGDLPALHSFPTRRSSDLHLDAGPGILGGAGALHHLVHEAVHDELAPQAALPCPELLLDAPEGGYVPRHHGELELAVDRSEEHTSELQSREKLVCRLLLEK